MRQTLQRPHQNPNGIIEARLSGLGGRDVSGHDQPQGRFEHEAPPRSGDHAAVTQRSAWFLAHRLREAWKAHGAQFSGPVEVDETFIGGKEKNKHANKKLRAGRGGVGKAIVVGAKDRETNRVSAAVVGNTDAKTLQGFVGERAAKGATVYTDDHGGYQGMPFEHETVKHSISEYVNGMAHTNGIESFWSMLKRGYHGTYHHMSAKHLQRYVTEFSGRQTQCPKCRHYRNDGSDCAINDRETASV